VKGDRDAAFLSSGTATASPGGSARYEGVITNADPVVTANRIVVIDTLAHPGDTTVSGLARSSAFATPFAGNLTASHPGVVSYSTSANPCTEELGATKAGCEPANWSVTPPSPVGSVRSIKLDFGTTPLPPGQSITFGFDVAMPATTSGVAYNTFAYRGFPSASPEPLLVSETAKVGLQANQPGGQGQLTVRKLVNGQDTTVDPVVVPVGSAVQFTFVVTNTGTGDAIDIRVADDKLGDITCPRTTLAAGESMTCIGPPHAALEGLHVNTVEGIWRTLAGTSLLVSPPSRGEYFGALEGGPALSLVKLLNNQHAPTAPGLLIPAGEPVTFTFRVVNTGRSRLSSITLVDDRIGAIACPKPSLGPGESMLCTTATQPAVEGPHVNTATARATTTDGDATTAVDQAYYNNTLPVTGAHSRGLAVGGAALVGLGVAMLALGHVGYRRRRAGP
jgi:hypothetical protein